ncbi:MAG: VanZ family protein [Candidatus Omnitrophota bacterium]|nr:VanZ family protein [Candidatus Omnitrophota bacterium]
MLTWEKSISFFKLWVPVGVYAVFIFWFSSLEEPLVLELPFPHADKLGHFLEYLIFGFLLIRALHGSGAKMAGRKLLFLTLAIGAFYGFTDELHQSVVHGRFATAADFIFDLIGTFTGAVIFAGWKLKND